VSDLPAGSTPPERNAELDRSAAEIARLAAGRFEILGPLGRDAQDAYAFLARPAGHPEQLVVLKSVAHDPFVPPALDVLDRLDASVPPPAGSCPVCQTPLKGWESGCPECGTDLAGAPVSSPEHLEQLRRTVRAAADGYEVLGDIPRADGGGPVFFARELPAGQIVALRLDQAQSPGERPHYTVAATRMMHPKMMYGTIGGEGQQAEPWRGTPTRPGSYPPAGFSAKVCPQCGDSFEGEIRFCPRDGTALQVGAAEGLIGRIIAERYRILEKLGEGGMGRVYLAEHIHMGRRCAVKVMSPALLHDPDSISRFAREAANASRITHPNVAAIYDYGQTPERIVYLAMELVEGGSLAHALEREGSLQPSRAVHIAAQVADALTAAHELGIVHRDLKPDNIMLARARTGLDQVKVVDFGIAKAQKGGKQTVTRAGFVVGTPAYMSPEQILGDELDGRSDLYSLGCILFEMLTGRRAFAGPSGEVVIRKRLTENPPPPSQLRPDLGQELDAIVIRSMGRSPDQRFGSAAELRSALESVAAASGQQTWWRSAGPARGEVAPAGASLLGTPAQPGGPPSAPSWTGPAAPRPSRLGDRSIVLRRRTTGMNVPLIGSLIGGTLLLAVAGFVVWRSLSRPERATGNVAPDSVLVSQPPSGADAGAAAGDSIATRPRADSRPDTSLVQNPPPGAVRQADSAALVFTSALPPDARVTIDGKPVPVPLDGRLMVAAGRHLVTAKAPGYRAGTVRVAVTPGETRPLDLTLSPATASHATTGDSARPVGSAASGGVPPAGAPATVAPGLIVIMGAVPPGAEIRVDGKPLPSGSRLASVPPGPHRVTLSAPGYGSDSTQLDVHPSEQAQWIVADRTPPLAPGGEPGAPVPNRGAPPTAPESPPATKPAESPVKTDAALDSGARALVQAYAQAVNARDIKQLRRLYPAMTADRERQWRDLFRDEVRDLTAASTVVAVVPGSVPQVEFQLKLGFRPEGGTAQSFQVHNRASLRQGSIGWQFDHLEERGE
jgi:eukaryotic-like serine/threonine-protein kinase